MAAALLTHEQEIVLAKRIERGDLAAKDKLIEANTGLVASIANKRSFNGEFEEQRAAECSA